MIQGPFPAFAKDCYDQIPIEFFDIARLPLPSRNPQRRALLRIPFPKNTDNLVLGTAHRDQCVEPKKGNSRIIPHRTSFILRIKDFGKRWYRYPFISWECDEPRCSVPPFEKSHCKYLCIGLVDYEILCKDRDKERSARELVIVTECLRHFEAARKP